jgi:hypothetical protein
MESKFLTPTQLWQDFDPEGKLDVSFVSNETRDNIFIKTLYFNAFREEGGFVRAFARILFPSDCKSNKKFILFLARPEVDPMPSVLRIAGRGYPVGYVDLSGEGEMSTQYEGCFAYGKYSNAKDNLHNCTPSALASPVLLWTKMQCRFVSLVLQIYPKAMPIAFAEEQTNEVLWPLCAKDSRIYGGVSLLGSGIVQEDDATTIEQDENAQKWAIALSPQAYAKYTVCPMLIVTASNHKGHSVDKLDALVNLLPVPEMCATVVSNRLCTQISDSTEYTIWRWIEGRYVERKELPKNPTVAYTLGDGTIQFTVTSDVSEKRISEQSLYFAYNEEDSAYRPWQCMTKKGEGDAVFKVRVTGVDKVLFVYASVRYRDGVEIASPLLRIDLPADMPRRRLTPSKLLYDTSMGAAFFAETKDIVLDSSLYGIGQSPNGVGGLYTTKGDLISFCVGESRRVNPEGSFSLSAYSPEERHFSIVITVWEDGQYHDYTAGVYLSGSPEWQRIRLDYTDFRDYAMLPMDGWNNMKKIRIRHAEGILLNNMLWT